MLCKLTFHDMREIDGPFQDWLKPFKLPFCHFDLYFTLKLQNTDESP